MEEKTGEGIEVKKGPSTGAIPSNLHTGSRSEILADYVFSTWGTVTPVRRQDDYGVDLYCTLTEQVGQRSWVKDYYSVQVKSTDDPWILSGRDSVEWLINNPQPLFLAWVDKKRGVLHVYHSTPRFHVGVFPPLPDRLTLKMEDVDDGEYSRWESGTEFSLSAPILRISLEDLLDDEKMQHLGKVLSAWVQIDRKNCDLFRDGLLRFQMPYSYRVNEFPGAGSWVEMGNAMPEIAQIEKGILTAAESAECIGGQIGQNKDRVGILLAALFVDHLYIKYPDVFKGRRMWENRLPSDLGVIVCNGLNELLKKELPTKYRYEGIDSVLKNFLEIPLVKGFLKK